MSIQRQNNMNYERFAHVESRGGRTRTADLCVPNAARYQLRHAPPLLVNYSDNLGSC